ncbi:MAG: DUF6069 family protein [Kineosporiaceae bacterium]
MSDGATSGATAGDVTGAKPGPMSRPPTRTGPPTWARRLVTILTAAGINGVVWVVAVRAAGLDLTVAAPGQGRQEVGLGVVVLTTVAAGLVAWVLLAVLAWVLLAVLRRVSPHGLEVWTVVAVVVTALSLAAPLLSEGSGTDRAALGLMHVAAAVTVVVGFRRGSR